MSIARTVLDLAVSPWALVALKATLALFLALAVAGVARRGRASLRHAIYSAVFAVLLLLPLSSRVMPNMPVKVPVRAQPAAPPTTLVPVTTPAAAPVATSLAAPKLTALIVPSAWRIYLAGVLFILGTLVAGVVRLRRWAAAGEVWLDGTRLATDVACASGIRRAVLVVLAPDIAVPLTFGFRRQTIVLPAAAREWDDDSLRRALRHELEHVRRDDWALQLLGRVACALYWPHPLVWVAWRRFCAEAERACDDAVVGAFEPTSYADQLVTLARSMTRRRRVPALAMASPTRLSERVHAILDPAQARGPHGRIATIATVSVMALTVAVFGSLRLVADEPSYEKAVDQGVAGGIDDGVRGGVDGGVHDAVEGAVALYQESVVRAAERGDIEGMQDLLDRGYNINATVPGDGTMLLISAKNGHTAAVRYLLDHGADPNTPSPGDGNPLVAAAGAGETAIAELLLDRGAHIDTVVPGDENALITAARLGRTDTVRMLIARGADVNIRVFVVDSDEAPHWRTALHAARRNGYHDIEQLLLGAGAKE